MFDLKGKTAVVIGAASGIGEAIAAGFARQRGNVVALDLHPDPSRGIGALDITDARAVDQVLADLDRRHGIDVLVCMPAVNVRKPILEYTDEELSFVLDVNLKGTFRVVRAAGRAMTARKKGSIVLFSSIRSQVVEPGQSVYAATKAGVVQLARTAAAEFGPFGVRVNAIAPGVIETPLTAPIKANQSWYDAYAARSILGRWGRADEIVGPAVFLASDASSYVTGTVLFVDGGWLAIDGRYTPPGM
ncbi:MAG TPA: SDR family oxidoreductase [Vicinamibacterales bacterium]|jgi:NAD(P)-dependent dehydrogenase (short-subunit alcohol dehydrogenase family)